MSLIWNFYRKTGTQILREKEMLKVYNETNHEGHPSPGEDDHRKLKYIQCSLGLFFLYLFFIPASAQPARQIAKYRLHVLGMNIGEYMVTQETRDDEINIKAITDVEVKIVFTYRVKYIQHSIYRDGSLWSCHVQTIKNGKINSDLHMEKRGEAYLRVEDGDSTMVHDKITYSGSMLYFNEPKTVSMMYNERSGESKLLKRGADHTYLITDEKNNKTNEYHYQDGVLTCAELKHSLAVIHLERFR